MSWNVPCRIALCLSVCFLVAAAAVASPLISIGHDRPTSWQQAIDDGNIQPVNPGQESSLSADFYDFSITQDPGANAWQQMPVLGLTAVPNVDINGTQRDSLVMSWDPPDMINQPNQLGVAAWEYVYGVDPDLTGTVVDFSIGPPPPGTPPPPPPMLNNIWDISFELRDINGNFKSWFLTMPQTGWANHTINPAGGSQGPWMLQGQTPGFDLTQVIALRFDGSVLNTSPFPPPPPGAPTGPWDWLPFDHLTVRAISSPEPSSIMFAALGLFGLGLFARRRRNAR